MSIVEFLEARTQEREALAQEMLDAWPVEVLVTPASDSALASVAVTEWSPKAYTRVWEGGEPDHGWRVHATAVEVWGEATAKQILAECKARRDIIEWHKNWPVLADQPMRPTLIEDYEDINAVSLRMSREIAWLTERQYVEHFGTEPPTAPILRMLASVWSDHADFNPAWM